MVAAFAEKEFPLSLPAARPIPRQMVFHRTSWNGAEDRAVAYLHFTIARLIGLFVD
jgi:hypothetical protein